MLPATDTVGATAFLNPRLLLRVRAKETILAGMIIVDPAGRKFLVGDHDATIDDGWSIARSHALFQMTDSVLWQRNGVGADPVTNLPTDTGPVTVGTIWCAIEHMGAMLADIGTRMFVEKRRVITGSPVKTHDLVDGTLVKRVTPIYGIYVAEIE